MNEEILKLAKECGLLTSKATEASMGQKDFYRTAFNAGITAAATTVCECVVTQMTGGLRKEFFDAIQKLEKT